MQPDKECDKFMVLTNNVTIATDQMHSYLFAIHKFSDYSGFEYPMP
jgi:CDP-diacylglycerol pyrophosphatase